MYKSNKKTNARSRKLKKLFLRSFFFAKMKRHIYKKIIFTTTKQMVNK